MYTYVYVHICVYVYVYIRADIAKLFAERAEKADTPVTASTEILVSNTIPRLR